MPISQCCRPVESLQARRTHRVRNLTVMILVLGGGLSLILYVHGASWWYAPLAVSASVLAHHIAFFGGIAFIVKRVARGRRAPDGNGCCQEAAGHTQQDQNQLIRWPRLYNCMVWVIMLGREKKLRRRMLDLGDLRPGGVVLDVGCGTGTLLLAAAERVGPSGALHGIEPAAEMVAYAQHKSEARRVSLEVIEGTADSLPYPPASFDTVFCTLVLHHLPRPMRGVAIREMRRVLRPGGRAVIVDLQRPRSLARAFTGAMSLVSILHNLSPSTSRFNVLDFEPLMTELGLEDITRHSFGSGAIGALVGRLGSGDSGISTLDA